MNLDYQVISLVVPVFVILLAGFTKKIIPAIMAGIVIGSLFIAKGDIFNGIAVAVDRLVKAVSNEDSLCIIMFLFVFGALGEIMKMSGGVKGFTNLADKYIKTERGALASIWLSTPFTFIDCCFHTISSGTIGKALLDRVKGNKYRFAHVLNVTSCLLIILIPFGTTYVGYIVSTIALALSKTNLNISAYSLFIQSIPFNFYAITMTLIALGNTVFNFGFNKKIIQLPKKNINEEDNHSHNHVHEESKVTEKIKPRVINLIFPLVLLIFSTVIFFWYLAEDKYSGFLEVIMNTDFEKAILASGIFTLIITVIFYLFQKISLDDIEAAFFTGGKDLIQPIIVLMLSWGLSSVIEELGFAEFVSGKINNNIPEILIPVIVFLIGCFISYFIGSAWGTWALLMPIATTLVVGTGLSLPVVIGAVLAGGSLGDNASPLGETVILTSTVSGVTIMEHVSSQLPYGLIAIAVSSLMFIISAALV